MKQVIKNHANGKDGRKQDEDRNNNYSTVGMAVVFALGAVLGVVFNNLILGVSLGTCGGMILGLAIEVMQD